jgi:hypothetical protein
VRLPVPEVTNRGRSTAPPVQAFGRPRAELVESGHSGLWECLRMTKAASSSMSPEVSDHALLAKCGKGSKGSVR